jgi:hypothetical protein
VLSGFGVRTISFVVLFFISNLHDQKVGQSEKQWMDGWMWMDVVNGWIWWMCMDE